MMFKDSQTQTFTVKWLWKTASFNALIIKYIYFGLVSEYIKLETYCYLTFDNTREAVTLSTGMLAVGGGLLLLLTTLVVP